MRFATAPAVVVVVLLIIAHASEIAYSASPPVNAVEDDAKIVLDNGILLLTYSKRAHQINSIKLYDGSANEPRELSDGRDACYFDVNGATRKLPPELEKQRRRADYQRLGDWADSVKLIKDDDGGEFAEIAVAGGPTPMFPFRNEVHWILRRGDSGFYAYATYTHGKGMPAADIGQTRFVVKGVPGTKLFTHHVVDDQRKGPFPIGKVAEQVQDATERFEDGSVYTKYDNTNFTNDDYLHGMAGPSTSSGQGVGLWCIWPSWESLNSGPTRQDLTVHEDNVVLAMFQSSHFGAGGIHIEDDESWDHVFGPMLYYVNRGESVDAMFSDAKQRAATERQNWPMDWLKRDDFPLSRSVVSGRVQVSDGSNPSGAWAILAPASDGDLDWSQSAKGYMFWTKLDADGRFSIEKVRPGTYNLFISGANQFVDFKKSNIEVKAGDKLDVGTLNWQAESHGRRLWQIGIADRSTAEFRDGDNPRNYDTFKKYFAAFPDDAVFTIGQSHEKTDWNYAQWSWFNKNSFWTIRFNVDGPQTGKATLTLGFASAQPAGDVIVKVNGNEVATFSLKKSGAAPYRSGSQDSMYNLKLVEFDAALLKPGANEITLGQSKMVHIPTDPVELKTAKRPPGAVMYDAIRLEVAP